TEMALGALLLQLPAQKEHLDVEELPRWMGEYSARILAPYLELFTEPLLTDSSMLEAYRAQGTDPQETP
ncbi:TetR family transcriptional regulator, partial [Klebsiella aerogenes]